MKVTVETHPLIITIDDEPAIRKSFKDFLEDMDFRVKEAENGARGLELFDLVKPDLVLLDLSMPEMDGFEVLKNLTSRAPDTPIIVVSGIGVIHDAVEALRLGAWDYLLKPVEDLSMLQHAVEKCLERARLIQENKIYQKNLEQEVARRTRQLDTTNKKLHETNIKLSNSEKKFRKLADISPMAIIIIQERKPVYINRSGEAITGYTIDELIKLDISQLFDDESKEQGLKKLLKFESEKPEYFREELKIITKKDEEKWIDISGGYADLQGNLSAIISFIDITERKANEDTLKNINKELEKRVSNRTIELETINRKLQDAKNKADETTEAKSSFLANMSHEIRTPMNGIIAAVDLALEEETSPEMERFLQIIQSSGYSLLGVINDILDFSKIEAGKLELEMASFQLNKLLQDATNPFISAAFEKKIDLLIDLEPGTPIQYSGDRFHIIQILSNLLSNAIKFTNELGTITISVTQPETSAPGLETTLQFCVKDTGLGMSDEQQHKIFQPFTQADISTTRKFGGTGLGLSISKNLAELMDGSIWVESEKAVGTAFYFTVRLQQLSEKPEFNVSKNIDFSKLSILVVDDNVSSASLLAKTLNLFNCQVATANSDEDAIQILKQEYAAGHEFDLLFIDEHMPETEGIANYRIIKEKVPVSLPVVLMNGSGHQAHLKSSLSDLYTYCLYKPFTVSSVFDCLKFIFGYSDSPYPKKSKKSYSPSSNYKKYLRGLRVLVAEDNPTNQEIAIAILEKADISVVVAENGQIALDAIKNATFDAILMDVQMPVVDGFQATRIIRNNPELYSLPIIAMTAHAMKGDKEKCLNAGMNGFITKPVNQELLFRTLAQHTGKAVPTFNNQVPDSQQATGLSMKLPDSLPGLEIHTSLRNLDLNADVYLRIIKKFYLYHKPLLQSLQSDFIAGSWSELKTLAHNIRGSAENIGAFETGERASLLEAKIEQIEDKKPEDIDLNYYFNQLYTSLQQLLDSLNQLITSYSATGSRDFESKVPLQQTQSFSNLKTELSDALENMDPKKVKSLMSQLKQDPNISSITKIEEKIGNYDYEDALKIIKSIPL